MQSVLNENDYFETSDLSLVAGLVACGAKIEAVDRTQGPRANFYIRREPGMDGLVRAFYAHELSVDAFAYFSALKEAKSRLYGPPIE